MGFLSRYRYELLLVENPESPPTGLDEVLDALNVEVDAVTLKRLGQGGAGGLAVGGPVAWANSRTALVGAQNRLKRAGVDLALVDTGYSIRASVTEAWVGLRTPASKSREAGNELSSGELQKAMGALAAVVLLLVGFLALGEMISGSGAPEAVGLGEHVTELGRTDGGGGSGEASIASSGVAAADDAVVGRQRLGSSESSDSFFAVLSAFGRFLPVLGLLVGGMAGLVLQYRVLLSVRPGPKPSRGQWAALAALPCTVGLLGVGTWFALGTEPWYPGLLAVLAGAALCAAFLTGFRVAGSASRGD